MSCLNSRGVNVAAFSRGDFTGRIGIFVTMIESVEGVVVVVGLIVSTFVT